VFLFQVPTIVSTSISAEHVGKFSLRFRVENELSLSAPYLLSAENVKPVFLSVGKTHNTTPLAHIPQQHNKGVWHSGKQVAQVAPKVP